MKKLLKVFSALTACLLMATAFAACEGKGDYYNENYTPTTVSFGTYAQKRVTDTDILGALSGLSANGAGRLSYGGNTYEKVTVASDYSGGVSYSDGTAIKAGETYYFLVESIEWIVLDASEGLIMAKDILDCGRFSIGERTVAVDEETGKYYYANNWCYSELRENLNGSGAKTFLSKAVTSLEKRQISVSEVVNDETTSYYKNHAKNVGTSYDYFFCLSYSETVEKSYGFSASADDMDYLRMAYVTDYARAKGAWCYTALGSESGSKLDGNGNWWLRSVGINTVYASVVRYNGVTGKDSYNVATDNTGIRPVTRLGN